MQLQLQLEEVQQTEHSGESRLLYTVFFFKETILLRLRSIIH